MDKIYYIYEWYDQCYYGFADYKGNLVHFAYKNFIAPSTYLFEIIPSTKEFLDKELLGEKYFRAWCEQRLPPILDYAEYCIEREKKELADIKLEHPDITNEQWVTAEMQFSSHLFRTEYLAKNRDKIECKKAICHFTHESTSNLPYDNAYMEWLD